MMEESIKIWQHGLSPYFFCLWRLGQPWSTLLYNLSASSGSQPGIFFRGKWTECGVCGGVWMWQVDLFPASAKVLRCDGRGGLPGRDQHQVLEPGLAEGPDQDSSPRTNPLQMLHR